MSVERQDKILTCKDCGEEFIFTVREQDFYVQKGFENDPARCGPCRNARKRDRNANPMSSGGGNNYGNSLGYSGGYGGNSTGGNNYGGGSYGNRPQNNPRSGNYGNTSNYGRSGNYGNGGGGNSYGNSMGNYGNNGNTRSSVYGNSGPSRSNMGNYGDQERKMYAITCANCGVQTEVPFAPRQGVPVFCRTCYNSQKGR